MSVAGTLYPSPGASNAGATHGSLVTQPVTVPPPCDCTMPIPVGNMVAYAKTHDDDASVGLDLPQYATPIAREACRKYTVGYGY